MFCLLGVPALVAFAWLLTLAPAEHAGRTFAAYDGVYIVASLTWLWAVGGGCPIAGTLPAARWR